MDKLTTYRKAIRQLLTRYTEGKQSANEVEVQLIFDDHNNHYQWIELGWQGHSRIYRCFVHVDILHDKVWLQRNMTDQDLAEDLVEMGVAQEDIVLGLQPPYKRPYTAYGVA